MSSTDDDIDWSQRCGYDDEHRDEACRRFVDEGRCHDHSEQAETIRQEVKNKFVEILSGRHEEHDAIPMKKAALVAGREVNDQKYPQLDIATIWSWRQKDPDFDARVINAKKQQTDIRVEMVEDAVFQQIMDGRASSTLVIFWLINQAPDSWKDKKEISQDISTDQEVILEGDVEHEYVSEAIHALSEGKERASNDDTEDQG